MDNLPQEVVDHIVDRLPAECEISDRQGNDQDHEESSEIWQRLHAVPFISRKFRRAMDRLIFRHMRITGDDVDAFEAAFTSARRRDFVSHIDYHIKLCEYAETAFPKFETAEDKKMNNKAATDAIASLFAVLAQWSAEKAIGLRITMNSPSDIRQRTAVFDRENITDIGPERWRFSYVQVDAQDLPLVPCIRAFHDETEMHRGREISVLSILSLTAKMPNLQNVSFKHVDPTTFLKFCDSMRVNVIDGINSSRLPSSVATATISMKPEPYFYMQLLPNKLGPDGLRPSISSAMHDFVNNLTTLDYSGQIDSSFFWPRTATASDPPPPFWQSMKEVTVQFEMSTPSGEWYFKPSVDQLFVNPLPDSVSDHLLPPGHNENQDDDVLAQKARMVWLDQLIYSQRKLAEARHGTGLFSANNFHWVVDEDVMAPLAKAMAKAISQMPKLERLTLSCRRFSQGGLTDPWYIEYRAPGSHSPRDRAVHIPEGAVTRPRVYILGVGWEAGAEVSELLLNCSVANHGVPAVLVSLEDHWQRESSLLQNDIERALEMLMINQGQRMVL